MQQNPAAPIRYNPHQKMTWQIGICSFALASTALAQMGAQSKCAHVVRADMEATRRDRPEVFSTIKTYSFEYSKGHDACVIIVQYRVHDKGDVPKIQVVALNAVTHQPMLGTDDVFLIPAEDTKQIEKTFNYLIREYSH